MPSIEPTIPLTPENRDAPLDEDATGNPAIPDEVPAPDTDDEVAVPAGGERGEGGGLLDELGIPSELIPHRRPV